MIAEVISIGDELTSGQRLDTNSQWLSQRLGEIGIAVHYHTTVADDLDANVRVFRQAAERADIVISTGGLGPTADDLTREALARLMGVELQLDPAALTHIQGLFARRKRDMPPRNVVQAMFPVGSHVIHNPHGTAPGIDLVVPPPLGRPCRVFCLPGVPAEMEEMWQQSLVTILTRMSGADRVIRHQRIKCFGVGESDLEAMLPDLIRRGRDPSVGITVSEATITLRITAAGKSPEDCLAMIAPTKATILSCLGSVAYGHEDDELEDAVVRLLADRGETLVTYEWGTAGLIADWLGKAAQRAPGRYLGGLMGDPATLWAGLGYALPESSADEPAALESLAANCRERLKADYCLAVGRFPAFDAHAAEPARLFLALATGAGVTVRSTPFAGHPAILRARAAKQALNMLRLALLGQAAMP